ncbi:early growth response protein 1-B-like isoform X2 [Trichogramma pretiosum]|uniref:early growth response protein 1-B-like isoform X2 n=1 Tax=Trichogramma pretiosum TaxID=7493 RepID=UPI000C71B2FA|nr:early growth response protein 1-B-like isoform X2 [Trichogramma pretiosum]
MESSEDIIGVKEEPQDTWPDASDDYDFDSVDSSGAKNIQMFPLYKSPETVDEKIFVDFEGKNVKLDLTILPANICKSEFKVKSENENQTNGMNQNIYIEFECKNVKLEGKTPSTTMCKTEDQSCLPIVKIENGNQTNDTNGNISTDFAVHCRTKAFECEICHKLFAYESKLNSHIKTVHDRSKPFECDIGHKSFGKKVPSIHTSSEYMIIEDSLSVTFVTNHLHEKVVSQNT